MAVQKEKHDDSSHRIIALDSPHENGIPGRQSSERKEHTLVDRDRVSQIPQYNKWMSGRSAVTLHR